MKWIAIKNPNNSHKYHDENHDEINSITEIIKRTHDDTQHQNSARPKMTSIDCDGVQLTNVQCHMAHISILWHRESWTKQLKYTFETRQEWMTISYHPTHCHDHTKYWYVHPCSKVIAFICNAKRYYLASMSRYEIFHVAWRGPLPAFIVENIISLRYTFTPG